MARKTQGLRSFHHKSRNGCTQCKRRKVKCDTKVPSCGSCIRRYETCEYRYIINYPNPLLKDCSLRQAKGATSPVHKGPTLMPTTTLGPSKDDFVWMTEVVLKRAWFAETESGLWARVMGVETRKTPYLGHCILSLAALQTSRPGKRGATHSVSAYQHHVQASELFRKVTPVVTEHNWLAVLAFQVFVLVFELTAQTYCTEAEFDIAKTLKVLRWNSKIGREAQPYFVVSKLWQVVVKRTTEIDLPPDPALQASLRTLGDAIKGASADFGNDLAKQQRAKICQEAFEGLCAWVDYCSSWPRSIDGYYYFPASLQPQFFEMLEDEDGTALLLVLYWSVVLWRSPMPAVWKWAYRTARFVMRTLQCRAEWRGLLEWPHRVLSTAASSRPDKVMGNSSASISIDEESRLTDPWMSASCMISWKSVGARDMCVVESRRSQSEMNSSALRTTVVGEGV